MAEDSAQTDLLDDGAAAAPEAAASEPAASEAVSADAAPSEVETVETAPEPESTEGADTPEAEPTLLEQTKSPGDEGDGEPAEESAEGVTAESSDDADDDLGDGEEAKADGEGAEEEGAEAKPEEEADAEDADAEAKADDDSESEAEESAAGETESEEAELEPIEYQYELPETIQMDDETREQTHAALDAFRSDPTNPQPLIDLHHEAMQRHEERLRQEQWDVFNDTRKQWRQEVVGDPEIGGAGHHTAMQAIARMRDRFASSSRPGTKAYDADLQAFDGMLRATGVGDHPVFLKMMHRVAGVYDEAPMGPVNVTPAPQPSGMSGIYDNPRSPKSKQ